MNFKSSQRDLSRSFGAVDIPKPEAQAEPTAQSPFVPFALLLLYVALVYLRPWEYRQYAEQFSEVPLAGILEGILFLAWLTVPRKNYSAPQFWMMIGLLACIPLSVISGTRWLGGAFNEFVDFIPAAVLFFIAATLLNSPPRLRQMFAVIGLVCALIAWHGIDQIASGIGWSGVVPIQDRIRYVGFLNDPNDLAIAFLIALPMALSFVRRGRSKLIAIAALAGAGAMLYAIYLTNSRGAIVALAAMLGVYSLRRYGLGRSLFMAPILLAVLIFAAPNRIDSVSADEESASGRIEAWYAGIQMLKQNPLLGVGKGEFIEHHERTAHNSFILAAAELGVIGYFFWFSIVALTVAMAIILVRGPPNGPPAEAKQEVDSWLEHQRLAGILLYSLTGYMTAAFFLSRSYIVMFYLMIAMVVGIYQSAHSRWESLPGLELRLTLGRLVALEFGSLIFLWLTTKVLLAFV